MLTGPGLSPASGKNAKNLIVLFHGYGSHGGDLLALAQFWAPLMPETEFFAPNGLSACEDYPLGYEWFALDDAFTPSYLRAGLDKTRPVIRNGLLQILAQRNLTVADLVLVGFSQGGMLALDMMFAMQGLKGVICYSGAFYPPQEPTILSPHPEVLLAHGEADTVVPYTAFLQATQDLKKYGLHPQTLTCPGLGHSIDEEGLKRGGTFLGKLFPQTDPM